MPRAKATDEITAEARAILTRGFAEGRTAAFIAQAVVDATGEELAPRTVARRAAEWRESKRRFDAGTERMKQLLQAADEMKTDPSAFIRALALDHLRENPNAFDDADPIRMSRAALSAEELQIKRRQVEVKERQVSIDERRLKLLEEKEQRAIAALTRPDQTKTAEERLREVQEIYGIAS